MTTPASTEQACTLVYYDGACPICSREIAWYRDRVGPDVEFRDVSQSSADPAPDLNREVALARFHVRRPDGSLVAGAEAFVDLWARVPGLGVVARIARWRPILKMLDWGYAGFLKVRPLWRPKA